MAQENAPQTPSITKWPALIREGYEELVNAIIRPPRAEYDNRDLGPIKFSLHGLAIERQDFQVTNDRDQTLQCSHWAPVSEHRFSPALPCVVVLHGNAGCRVEAVDALPAIIGAGATCCAVDLSGSGLSDGETISLGWFERDDVAALVAHLRATGTVSTIGLWGRSMGAVTALLHGHRDPSIGCFILDSPFASLAKLSDEIVDMLPMNIPKFAVGMVRRMVRSSVQSRAGFDINELDPAKHAVRTFIPALFAHAKGDKFILPHHTDEIHAAYCGEKNKVTFPGDHNSPRPSFFFDSAGIWIQRTLLSEDEIAARDAFWAQVDPAPLAGLPSLGAGLSIVPGGMPQLGVGAAMGHGGAAHGGGGGLSNEEEDIQRAIALSLGHVGGGDGGSAAGLGDDTVDAELAAVLALSAQEHAAAEPGVRREDEVEVWCGEGEAGDRPTGEGPSPVFSPNTRRRVPSPTTHDAAQAAEAHSLLLPHVETADQEAPAQGEDPDEGAGEGERKAV